MAIPNLPYTDPTTNLHYRLSNPNDHPALRRIDSSFTTNKIYYLEPRTSGPTAFEFNLIEIQLVQPLHKQFPEDDDDEDDVEADNDENEFTLVVEQTTSSPHTIVGFITARFSAWNSRLTITDFEIQPSHRRKGIGRFLIQLAEKTAHLKYPSIQLLWLEVSNVNYPAVASYLKMGFVMAGFDRSLYMGTKAEGEFAIFMWKRLDKL